MVKFRHVAERDIRNDPLRRWLTWFDRESPQPLVEEVVKMDAAIQKAAEKMEYVTIDKEALRVYQMREMALSDWTGGLNHGREEGEKKGKWEAAAKMRRRGVPVSQIAEDTGLSVEDIAKR